MVSGRGIDAKNKFGSKSKKKIDEMNLKLWFAWGSVGWGRRAETVKVGQGRVRKDSEGWKRSVKVT